jgi:hypothetical protein
MQPAERSEPAIIQIDVLRGDEESLLSGTFRQPYPLVKVKQKTNVLWRLIKADEDDRFIVSFSNGSPFEGVSAIGDQTPPLPAVNIGSFHYQVFVVAGISGEVYAVHHCPEMRVESGDDGN